MAWGRLNLRSDLKVNARIVERAKAHLRAKERQVTAHQVLVGISDAAGREPKKNYKFEDTEVTLAQVARWIEFGSKGIPERPFMRSWFDAHEERLKGEMRTVIRREYEGDKDAVAQTGARWAEELREWILADEGGLAPLAVSTIARKAAAGLPAPEVPIVATKQLADAIVFMEGRPK